MLEESLESEDAIENTAKSVVIAPKKANRGTENQKGREIPIMLSRKATEAPNAAPEEIPKVYGSAKGF